MAAVGYFSDWSLEPGRQAEFHLSSPDPDVAVRLLRLDRLRPEAPAWPIAATAPVERQTLDLGSSVAVELAGLTLPTGAWAITVEFSLTVPPEDRALIAAGPISLGFDRAGAIELTGPSGRSTASVLPTARWMVARLEQRGAMVGAEVTACAGGRSLATLQLSAPAFAPAGFRLGKADAGDRPSLNARLGRVALHEKADRSVATWRFPPVGRPEMLEGAGARLRIENAPTFALRSARWDGSANGPEAAPDHYDAIALHDDDLCDLRWPVTHSFTVPEDAPSGVYAFETRSGDEVMRWPFFVTAGRRSANLVFLVPSFTYLAYANERLPPERFPWIGDDRGHRFARANQLTSLYDEHNDGTGVSLASRRRPLVTIRDDYLYPLCGAPHLLPVDLQLLRFLDEHGIAVDILTDEALDGDGAARLDGYRGLVTGSHPEYWTPRMRDAVDAFNGKGGAIAYLGGNGCYWVTASDARGIEVRRGQSGIRTWSAEPDETWLATRGERGGLWRERGAAEHRLLGVGMTAMGFSQALPFRRSAASWTPDLAWLFEGIGDAPIGDSGRVLGGAAGYEIDARRADLGTPQESVVLATAEDFDAGYVPDDESAACDAIRAEMVLTQRAGRGLVFAASSVAWCGALPQRGTMNAVGRITLNLLHGLLHRLLHRITS